MTMPHDKPGPKEQELRAMREARLAANKRKIDKNIDKTIKQISQTLGKGKKRKGVVVQLKTAKRGRTGR
jgi:hypothetical protein